MRRQPDLCYNHPTMTGLKFVTTNTAKVELANQRLGIYGFEAEQMSLNLSEIQSFDVEEVAAKKAEQVMSRTKSPFFVEDSGLYIKALKGFPGAMIKLIIGTLGDKRLLRLLSRNDPRDVEVVSIIVYGDPRRKLIKTFRGVYAGKIAQRPRGRNTRGWLLSRVFIPRGRERTLAELNEAGWRQFLRDFRHNDHFDKFGRWLSQ